MVQPSTVQTATGGGGGTTYTAGDGIAIADDTISVDLVQETGSDTKKVMSQKAVTDALASAGGVKILTSADYNANSSNWDDTDTTHFNAIALWRLDSGVYMGGSTSVKIYPDRSTALWCGGLDGKIILVKKYVDSNSERGMIVLFASGGVSDSKCWYNSYNDGISGSSYQITPTINNSLTSTATNQALSANQGKVLNDKFGGMQLVSISQTDYDNLGTKDPNTLYIITGA